MSDPTKLQRIHNLKRLIDERFDGVISAFAREVGMHPTYVSNILGTLRNSKGKRPLSAAACERIETALDLPPGELSRTEPSLSSEAERRQETIAGLESLFARIDRLERHATEANLAISALVHEVQANGVLDQVLIGALARESEPLGKAIERATREVARRVEAGEPLHEQAEAISEYLAALPRSDEAAAERAAWLGAKARGAPPA